MNNNPVFRESVVIFFGEGHGFAVYFYLLVILAPVEFLSLYIPSLDVQMWAGSASLFKVSAVTSLLLMVYFAMRVANQEFAAWRFQPARRWLRDEKLSLASFGVGQLAFLLLHLLVSLAVCAPLLIWAGAIARTESKTILVTLLLLAFYSFAYAVWGLVALNLWERKPEARQVCVRCVFFLLIVVSALVYLPLNPVGFLLAYLARQELAALGIGGWQWPGGVVHFSFHLLILGLGLVVYGLVLKRGATT